MVIVMILCRDVKNPEGICTSLIDEGDCVVLKPCIRLPPQSIIIGGIKAFEAFRAGRNIAKVKAYEILTRLFGERQIKTIINELMIACNEAGIEGYTVILIHKNIRGDDLQKYVKHLTDLVKSYECNFMQLQSLNKYVQVCEVLRRIHHEIVECDDITAIGISGTSEIFLSKK
jgi:tRNA threonylcarbamoyladenosine modification (KEOPS) complex Cgi121 subunit